MRQPRTQQTVQSPASMQVPLSHLTRPHPESRLNLPRTTYTHCNTHHVALRQPCPRIHDRNAHAARSDNDSEAPPLPAVPPADLPAPLRPCRTGGGPALAAAPPPAPPCCRPNGATGVDEAALERRLARRRSRASQWASARAAVGRAASASASAHGPAAPLVLGAGRGAPIIAARTYSASSSKTSSGKCTCAHMPCTCHTHEGCTWVYGMHGVCMFEASLLSEDLLPMRDGEGVAHHQRPHLQSRAQSRRSSGGHQGNQERVSPANSAPTCPCTPWPHASMPACQQRPHLGLELPCALH